jgi:hypothetical protein
MKREKKKEKASFLPNFSCLPVREQSRIISSTLLQTKQINLPNFENRKKRE